MWSLIGILIGMWLYRVHRRRKRYRAYPSAAMGESYLRRLKSQQQRPVIYVTIPYYCEHHQSLTMEEQGVPPVRVHHTEDTHEADGGNENWVIDWPDEGKVSDCDNIELVGEAPVGTFGARDYSKGHRFV